MSRFPAGNPDGLSEEEVTFYDALEVNEAAVRDMKHEDLVRLAQGANPKSSRKRQSGLVGEGINPSRTKGHGEGTCWISTVIRQTSSGQAIETVIKQAEALTEEWLETR